MKIFTLNDKLADIVRKDILLFSVINRLGITNSYGELTIEEACKREGISNNLFLVIVNTFVNNNYTPDDHLIDFSIDELVKYFEKSHELYNNYFIPSMQELFVKMRKLDSNTNVSYVNSVYIKAQKMFTDHYSYEDKIVFPCIINSVQNNTFITNNDVIDFVLGSDDHNVFVEELDDLLNIFLKYVNSNCRNDMAELLAIMHSFSRDLSHHMLIEDKYFYSRIRKYIHG